MIKRNCLFYLVVFYSFVISSKNNYYHLTSKSMKIWDKIDLVRAIYTTQEQKEEFVNVLFKEIKSLHHDYLKSISDVNYSNDKSELINLIESILKNFNEVFGNISTKKFTLSCDILREVLFLLKAPVDIKSEISSDHISGKYSFTGDGVIIKNRYKRIK